MSQKEELELIGYCSHCIIFCCGLDNLASICKSCPKKCVSPSSTQMQVCLVEFSYGKDFLPLFTIPRLICTSTSLNFIYLR